MKKAKKNFKKQNKLIPFVILAIFLVAVLYIAQNAKQQPSQSISNPSKQQAQEQNQQVLDCAKKLDQNQLAMGKQTSDCLFLGCGGFFQ